ncbi:MAG: hypothetical protein ACTHJG_01420 [Rhodanobacteraceae bacterium]
MKAAVQPGPYDTLLGFVALPPFFSAGIWAMWQEHLVGSTAAYAPTKLQPVGVIFKGSTRYLNQLAANSYHLSQILFNAAFVYVLCIASIWVLVNRIYGRNKA